MIEIFNDKKQTPRKLVKLQVGSYFNGRHENTNRLFVVAVDENGNQLNCGVLAEITEEGIKPFRDLRKLGWPRPEIIKKALA
jgi:hypothetical protein